MKPLTMLAIPMLLVLGAGAAPTASAHFCWEHACGDCNTGVFHVHYNTLNDPLQPYCVAALPAGIGDVGERGPGVQLLDVVLLTDVWSSAAP